MMTLVFMLEEPSAKEMLKGLLPHVLPESVAVFYQVFDGKQDLDKRVEDRLRHWLTPNTHFVVVRDQDSSNCVEVKSALVAKCQCAGKPDALVRIACRELESWYLGDLQAVEAGLGLRNLAQHQNKAKYREPDALGNPAEELERLTNNAYQKVSGSRAIGPHLSPDNARSRSFAVFVSGIRRLVSGASA